MEQASGKDFVRVLVVPGRSRSKVLVGRGEHVLATFRMAGAPSTVVPELIEMVDDCFDVVAWFVDAGGFQRPVMEDPAVAEVCARLGVGLIALAPTSTVSQ